MEKTTAGSDLLAVVDYILDSEQLDFCQQVFENEEYVNDGFVTAEEQESSEAEERLEILERVASNKKCMHIYARAYRASKIFSPGTCMCEAT